MRGAGVGSTGHGCVRAGVCGECVQVMTGSAVQPRLTRTYVRDGRATEGCRWGHWARAHLSFGAQGRRGGHTQGRKGEEGSIACQVLTPGLASTIVYWVGGPCEGGGGVGQR